MTQAPPQQPSAAPGTKPATLFFGPDGLRAGWSLLLFFAILTPLVFGLIQITKRLHPASAHQPAAPATPRQLLIPEATQLALLGIATFAMAKIEGRAMAAYGIGRLNRRGFGQFATGAFWGIACLSLLVLLLVGAGKLAFDGRLLYGGEALRDGAVWLGGFLLVGLLEEFFVRGYLQFTLARGLAGLYEALVSGGSPAMARTVGFWLSGLFFSILFGLGHGSNPGESPLGLLSAGLAGLVFVFSLWRTGSLFWAIGFHTTWDWAQSFLYGVADSGNTIQGHLYRTHPVGSPLLSGGTTGPEGSVFVVPTLMLVAVVIRLTLPHGSQPVAPDPELSS